MAARGVGPCETRVWPGKGVAAGAVRIGVGASAPQPTRIGMAATTAIDAVANRAAPPPASPDILRGIDAAKNDRLDIMAKVIGSSCVLCFEPLMEVRTTGGLNTRWAMAIMLPSSDSRIVEIVGIVVQVRYFLNR